MVHTNPNRAGRFFAYNTLQPAEREALTERINGRVVQRRHQFRNRQIWSERGLRLDEIPNNRAREIAMERDWTTYVRDPEPYDEELVRDFYAAMIPPAFNEFSSVVVRDRIVRMPAEAICAHYGVPRPDNLDATFGLTPIQGVRNDNHLSTVLSSNLRRSGKEIWIPHQHDIKKYELRPEIAIWMKFLKCSLAPSSHDNTVDAYFAKILYHMQFNLPMDIGHIIKLHLIDAASNTNNVGILPFPCLITRFCREAGCDVGVMTPPLPSFDRNTFRAQVRAADRFDAKEAANREGNRMNIPAGVDDMEADDADDADYNPATDMEGVVLGTDIPSLALQMYNMEMRLNRRLEAIEEGRRYDGRSNAPNTSNQDEAGPSNPRRRRRQQ